MSSPIPSPSELGKRQNDGSKRPAGKTRHLHDNPLHMCWMCLCYQSCVWGFLSNCIGKKYFPDHTCIQSWIVHAGISPQAPPGRPPGIGSPVGVMVGVVPYPLRTIWPWELHWLLPCVAGCGSWRRSFWQWQQTADGCKESSGEAKAAPSLPAGNFNMYFSPCDVVASSAIVFSRKCFSHTVESPANISGEVGHTALSRLFSNAVYLKNCCDFQAIAQHKTANFVISDSNYCDNVQLVPTLPTARNDWDNWWSGHCAYYAKSSQVKAGRGKSVVAGGPRTTKY